MADYGDDFDPSMHTEDERLAHHWARYEDDADYRDELNVLAAVVETLDDAARAVIAHVDPVGAAMFGEPWRGGVDDSGNPQPVDPARWLDEHLPGASGE